MSGQRVSADCLDDLQLPGNTDRGLLHELSSSQRLLPALALQNQGLVDLNFLWGDLGEGWGGQKSLLTEFYISLPCPVGKPLTMWFKFSITLNEINSENSL